MWPATTKMGLNVCSYVRGSGAFEKCVGRSNIVMLEPALGKWLNCSLGSRKLCVSVCVCVCVCEWCGCVCVGVCVCVCEWCGCVYGVCMCV